ncbi:MAG: hypothetical protein PHV13_01615 [Candidatus ainarchaeum sp.]|nr:hypothetical protein [Candidatus ainarchaeum sp.]
MNHPERGQVAAEFMLYTAVFMFVVIASFVVISQLQGSEIPLRQNTVAEETGEGFASILTLAVKGGEGFTYSYAFPKTIFGLPYVIDLNELAYGKDTFIMEWAGPYGNFSYSYAVPAYDYRIAGTCLSGNRLLSNQCSNVLVLNNDGKKLTITQGE